MRREKQLKRKFYFGLAFVGIMVIYAGILGCGKSKPAADSSSVPVETGEHIKFGSYQGEEIEWRVLDVKDGNVLLLSEYGLDVQPFHETQESNIAWEDCTLRQWLNVEFYESAFTEEEKEKIVLSTSEGFPEYNSSMPGGKPAYRERETEDNVFLLSYTELYRYISDDTTAEMSDSDRLCYPTEYAKSNSEMPLNKDACGWWLCSVNQSAPDGYRPMAVTVYGQIQQELGAAGVTSMQYAVRPAVWIKW